MIQEIWVDKGTEFAGLCRKLCKLKKIQNCSTMSSTKAEFPERTARSMKNIFYRYMEHYGYEYLHKFSQFMTSLNFRKNCSIDFRIKDCQEFRVLFILYSKPLHVYRKPKFNIEEGVHISKYDLPITEVSFHRDTIQKVAKYNREQRASSCFLVEKTFKFLKILLSAARSLPLPYGYCWSHECTLSGATQLQRNVYSSWGVQKIAKCWDAPCERRAGREVSSTVLGNKVGSNAGVEFQVFLRGTCAQTPESVHKIVHMHSLMIYTDLLEC